MKNKDQLIKIIVKTVISVICIVILGYISFFLLLIFGFGGEQFYMGVVTVCFFLLLALIPISIFGMLRFRTRVILWLMLFGGIVITTITK